MFSKHVNYPIEFRVLRYKMQYVILSLLALNFIDGTSYERMTKENGVFCSNTFPVLKSWSRKCSGKRGYYVPKINLKTNKQTKLQRHWGIPYCLSHCRRMCLSSLLPELWWKYGQIYVIMQANLTCLEISLS